MSTGRTPPSRRAVGLALGSAVLILVVSAVVLGAALSRRPPTAGPSSGAAPTPSAPAPSVPALSTSGPSPSPSSPGGPTAVLVGAGDIADCGATHDEATAALVDGIPGIVFTAGDNAYSVGSANDYRKCYDPSWGRFRARTRPALGNHDAITAAGAPYFDYFGAAAGDPPGGWYSYEAGTWHVIVLNSDCPGKNGCGEGSAQLAWLRADLAAHPVGCTLAIWHHPRFSSGEHGNDRDVAPFWRVLYAAGADVVINGHDHDYERFAPQTPAGVADPVRGIREFVVGTGGKALRRFGRHVATSEVSNATTYGVIRLDLAPGGYRWRFIPVAGSFTDSGSGVCH